MIHRLVAGLALAVASLLALRPALAHPTVQTGGTADQVPDRPAAAIAQGDFAGAVEIGGGRRLYLECRGAGSPTVVLEAGYRSPMTVWTDDLVQPDRPRVMVRDGIARDSRVCVYERPGTAAVLDGTLHPSLLSDPVPQPRSAESVVADLHAVLQAAGVPGPYVLVGHSLGGLFVRLYAATFPTEVVGLVLVDAWYEGLEEHLTPDQWAGYLRAVNAVPPELAGYRELETIDFVAASAAMRAAAAANPLPTLPLAVLAHSEPFGLTAAELGFSPEVLETGWRAAQVDLGQLVPRARYFVADASAHYIQLQQPALVVEAVRQVVAGVRATDTWTDLAACCSLP